MGWNSWKPERNMVLVYVKELKASRHLLFVFAGTAAAAWMASLLSCIASRAH